jgi:CHAD domain-containing protein
MSEHAIEFLRGWIGEKVHCQPSAIKIEKQAETLARECAAKAAEAGIPLEDIQEEVGDIQELIASRLEEAAEADQGQEPAGKAVNR